MRRVHETEAVAQCAGQYGAAVVVGRRWNMPVSNFTIVRLALYSCHYRRRRSPSQGAGVYRAWKLSLERLHETRRTFFVYIGADGGTVYQDRADRWERIHRGKMTLSYRDMVWHDGKVWATNDHGVCGIENGKLKRANVSGKVRICSGHLSVGDGVMLLAGVYGAAMHDGNDWQIIIDYSDLQ